MILISVIFKKLLFKFGSAFSWIAAANECFQMKTVPTIYSNSEVAFSYDDSIMWSGMFKTNVIYKRSAEIPGNKFYEKFSLTNSCKLIFVGCWLRSLMSPELRFKYLLNIKTIKIIIEVYLKMSL